MIARQNHWHVMRQDEPPRGPERIGEILPFVLARVGLSQTPPGGEAEPGVAEMHAVRSSFGTVRRTVSLVHAYDVTS